jgi:hypothetical protein
MSDVLARTTLDTFSNYCRTLGAHRDCTRIDRDPARGRVVGLAFGSPVAFPR